MFGKIKQPLLVSMDSRLMPLSRTSVDVPHRSLLHLCGGLATLPTA